MSTPARTLDDLGLAPEDRARLEASSIAPEVAAARGHTTVYRRAHLEKLGFSSSQRNVPALLIPVYDAIDGRRPVLYQTRPHAPRHDVQTGKPIKYETPRGASMMVDVHPLIRAKLRDPKIPLFITEGVRKGDSAVSRGLCCVALLGVWNWRGRNGDGGLTALPDWEVIALNGRTVYVVFDSDVMTKGPVYKALARLKAFLERKGATVQLIYLPSGPGGAKVGLDDYLAGGRAVDDLLALATPTLREPPAETAAAPEGRGPSQATRLVALALAAGAELFHDADGHGYLTVPVGDHRETWRLRGTGGRDWLLQRYFAQAGQVPNAQALQDALAVLVEGRARFEGPRYRVWTRIAEHEGALYLDLADAGWRAAEVTAAGWRVVMDVPVKFRRTPGLLPLPAPIPGGSVTPVLDLFPLDESARRLVLAWLLATFRPDRPFPILLLRGEQGSAKSTLAKVLRALVDPHRVPLRRPPRDERDLMIAATNGWLVAFDNVSATPDWLSDALCCLSTGAGFGTRQLWTDDEEKLFAATRPCLLNGITDLATRGDLLDRALLVELPAIAETARRPEADVWREVDAACPQVLGALLTAVSTALRRREAVRLDRLPRMADFALFVEAAAPALGWEPGSSFATYTANRDAGHDLALDASPVGPALLAFMAERETPWEGSKSELLGALTPFVDERVRTLPAWPKSGRGLDGALKRLAPSLRARGVRLDDLPRWGRGRRVRLTPTPPEPVGGRPSPPSPEAPSARLAAAFAGDGSGDGRDGDRHQSSLGRHRPSARTVRDNDGGDGGDGLSPASSDAPTPTPWPPPGYDPADPEPPQDDLGTWGAWRRRCLERDEAERKRRAV